VLAYDYHERGATKVAIVFVGLALLFQPLAKVALGRGIWNVVDVLVRLVYFSFKFPKDKQSF
jgi:hypothetical protein